MNRTMQGIVILLLELGILSPKTVNQHPLLLAPQPQGHDLRYHHFLLKLTESVNGQA